MTITEYIDVRDALVLRLFLKNIGVAESREDFTKLFEAACATADDIMHKYVRAVTGKTVSQKTLTELLAARLVHKKAPTRTKKPNTTTNRPKLTRRAT